MRYYEYLSCAEKHLKGCTSLLLTYTPNSIHDMHVWLELYYLSGYIIEGITVYSVYKLYNWHPYYDIQKNWDPVFTQNTGLDFYRIRTIGNNVVFPDRTNRSLSVQSHNFQEIVKNLLRTDPSFNDIPYIGMGNIDSDVEVLIDSWRPDIRYKYQAINPFPNLCQDVIFRLINTCKIIYTNHI